MDISLGFWSYSTDQIWYPKVILIGASVFYVCLGMISYFKIREPSYPPPPPPAAGSTFFARTAATLKTITKECFSHRFYALIFLWMTLSGLADVTGQWKTPMKVSLGIDLGLLGQLGAWSGLVGLVLTVLTANFGDRFKAMPLMLVAATGLVLTAPIGLLYLVPGLPSGWYFYIELAYVLTHIPVGLVFGMASGPLLMELFPRDRYGQFSAAGSMIRNTMAGMLGAYFVSRLLDWFKVLFGGSDYYLRFSYTWQIFFQAANLLVLFLIYRHWERLGGAKGFRPPAVPNVTAPQYAAAEEKVAVP